MWTHKDTFTIGGLENVGYAPLKDLLIVLSGKGQGIFDCTTGEKIARESSNAEWWKDFNEATNSIFGFDQLKGIEIQTSGLFGGDRLPKATSDGWTLIASEPQPDDKPFDNYLVKRIYLVSPDKKQNYLVGKDGPCELRAFGFSSTGNSFIVALSCDLTIYSRNEHIL